MDVYKNIPDKEVIDTFHDYIDALGVKNLDYYAFGIQDTILKTSASVMSREEWQKVFIANEFAAHDPLRKAVFNTRRSVIFFQDLDTKDAISKEIMTQRKKYELGHGIILVERQLRYNLMLTICSNFSKFDAYDYYMKNAGVLTKIFDDFKLIMNPITRNYIHASETKLILQQGTAHKCIYKESEEVA